MGIVQSEKLRHDPVDTSMEDNYEFDEGFTFWPKTVGNEEDCLNVRLTAEENMAVLEEILDLESLDKGVGFKFLEKRLEQLNNDLGRFWQWFLPTHYDTPLFDRPWIMADHYLTV